MRKAIKEDKDLVVGILCSAFKPIKIPNSINFVVKQDKHRNHRLKILMEYMFYNALKFGDILISDNEKGVILLQYHRKKMLTFNTVFWDIKLAFCCIGIENVYKVLKRENALKKYHPKEPHIHPWIMAVKSEHWGRGTGVRLIQEAFEYYKDNDLPIIIETTTNSNLKLYKKFGFKIIKETHELDYPLYFLKR
ncbi:GNAT family N-acetyltransferase [Sinomicrobium kalidii]|uniref:GNAT family N-acetyltransferase n=1 Tax=Sinomicrobium kalidii TaxID=2900738 RepID=UPI001E6366C2|nr:GNAT family N-acetyltransferase [Sinomicrobium kalidii]UGU15387.1 GNAT family N-acetyltransferase [Sinomicrobium kalidii]